MLKRISWSLALTAFLCLGQTFAAFAAERRVALVIGNAKYKEAPLSNPVNDARDMAAALQRTGFEVITALDASQKEMNRAIARFGDLLKDDTVALFYYAGHGMQVRGKNYLIPIDAEIKSESSVRVESVDVDGVLDQLSTSDLNVVILDACRNNPFERRANRSVGSGGLAQMEAPKGTLIAYATAPGRTAADGDGRNGLYTQELLKQIQVPGLTIEQVFKNVRREVAKATRDGQIPWESSSMTGDFYFLPGSRSLATAAPNTHRSEKTAAVPPVVPAKDVEVRPVSKPVAIEHTERPLPLPNQTTQEETRTAMSSATHPKPAAPGVEIASVVQISEGQEKVIKTDTFTATGKWSLERSSGAMTGDGNIEWKNGDRYEGALVAGKKTGKGIFTWHNGQRYDGEWRDDIINGTGILYYTNGDRYEGTFKDGEPHGSGTYILRNGDIYTGAWLTGNRHGFGRLTWTTGDYWEGEFRDGKQTENGRMHSISSLLEKSAEKMAGAADKNASKKKNK